MALVGFGLRNPFPAFGAGMESIRIILGESGKTNESEVSALLVSIAMRILWESDAFRVRFYLVHSNAIH
jgi:hypothetical protein